MKNRLRPYLRLHLHRRSSSKFITIHCFFIQIFFCRGSIPSVAKQAVSLSTFFTSTSSTTMFWIVHRLTDRPNSVIYLLVLTACLKTVFTYMIRVESDSYELTSFNFSCIRIFLYAFIRVIIWPFETWLQLVVSIW